MALPEFLILRKPRSGCLEERTALIQPILNSLQPRPAGGIAESAAGEWSAAVPHPPVPPVLSGRDQVSPTPSMTTRTRSRMPMPEGIQCDYGNCMIICIANS
jgi:hypothetical protein